MSSSVKNQVRVGNICESNSGENFLIIAKYGKQILIKFIDDYGYECIRERADVRDGKVKNPYEKSAYGVGATGNIENATKNPQYKFWLNLCKRYVEGELPNLNQRWLIFEYWLEDIKTLTDYHNFSQKGVSITDPFDLYDNVNNLKIRKRVRKDRFYVRVDLFTKDFELYSGREEASEETGYHRETITRYAKQQKVVDGFQYFYADEYAKLFLI